MYRYIGGVLSNERKQSAHNISISTVTELVNLLTSLLKEDKQGYSDQLKLTDRHTTTNTSATKNQNCSCKLIYNDQTQST